ncbi:MAG: carboxymuconolactone decarboxylase family protein [Janthinobacterium lividum]
MSEDTRYQHGLDIVEKVYGPGSSEMMKGMEASPFVNETVSNLFGEVWSRPGLSMRDKRLLVLGATATMGRPDLVEIQTRGALLNEEFTEAQLEEISLLMLFYVGAGNTTALHRGMQTALAKLKAEKVAIQA